MTEPAFLLKRSPTSREGARTVIQAILHATDLVARELFLFAGTWTVVGLADELVVDLLWGWLRLRGRGKAERFAPPLERPLRGPAAVFVPCWQEAPVIGAMLDHARTAWPHAECRFFVGCYPNDLETIAAVRRIAVADERVRIAMVERQGPTTKADCLNALYSAMAQQECDSKQPYRMVVLHDAEDQVHPTALALLDERLDNADFVQLPVVPDLQLRSRWVAGHYGDEFAESHGKTMVVRNWLGTALPAAGVGCAFRREILARIAATKGSPHPFSAECLTEDYELGLLVAQLGCSSEFVRAIDEGGQLIATREFFPANFSSAVRQKARWMHGIALQGWDRLGWSGGLGELWMRMRDRRGPLAALVVMAAYLAAIMWMVLAGLQMLGLFRAAPSTPLLHTIVFLSTLGLAWRAIVRTGFTATQYGWREGLFAVPRMVVANVILMTAAQRALAGYIKTLRGQFPVWDKTRHDRHPAEGLAA